MSRRRCCEKIDGWLPVDKPRGMTSSQVVSRVRRLLGACKAGHAGTLDPLATGMLPIALGEATKTVSFIMDGLKIYRCRMRWGTETRTDDEEGEMVANCDQYPKKEQILEVLPRFLGHIMQIPPDFSAIRINGARAYDIARGGSDVILAPRPVHVHRLELLSIDSVDSATFEIECGKGTYIRSLARDMGRILGCFGHVSALRRLKVGPFSEKDLISLEHIEYLSHIRHGQVGSCVRFTDELSLVLKPVAASLDDIPVFAVNRQDADRLRNGQSILSCVDISSIHDKPVRVLCSGALVALGVVECGKLRPTRVFNLSGGSPTDVAQQN